MALPVAKLETQAPAPNRGLPIPGLWWQPSRIAYHDGQNWKTLPYANYIATAKWKASKSIAVSPIGADGHCYFIGFDVDGDWQDVEKLLKALPEGSFSLVSVSGKKGWHLWLFPGKPVDVQTAVCFASAVREKAGVACEIFPHSRNSKCLKWPGSLHPETGEVETFVSQEAPYDLDRMDTSIILELLASGSYRTPAEVIDKDSDKHRPIPPTNIEANTSPILTGTHLPPAGAGKLLNSLDDLARMEEVVDGLMRLADRQPVRLGKAFKCILPGHEERKPSGSFFRARDGHILYGDFHQRDGEATYTLGEVYHALVTGKVEKLRPVDKGRWLAGLALKLGFTTELVEEQKAKLAKITSSLNKNLYTPKEGVYSSSCSPKGDCEVFKKVLQVVEEEALLSAMSGFEEIKLSARFLARRARVKLELGNKAINLFCVLGVLEKVPGSGGIKGDRFKLCEVNAEEVMRRWEALGKPSLRQFNRSLVVEKLGEEIAAKVFRRKADGSVCNQLTANDCSHQEVLEVPSEALASTLEGMDMEYPYHAHTIAAEMEQRGNELLKQLQEAEAAGNEEKCLELMRLHYLAAKAKLERRSAFG